MYEPTRVDSVEVQWMPDDAPDISWLDQDGYDDDGTRRASYGDAWIMLGVQASASVYVDGVHQTITSGGLWGIESDSDEAYKRELEAEQRDELASILETLGLAV